MLGLVCDVVLCQVLALALFHNVITTVSIVISTAYMPFVDIWYYPCVHCVSNGASYNISLVCASTDLLNACSFFFLHHMYSPPLSSVHCTLQPLLTTLMFYHFLHPGYFCLWCILVCHVKRVSGRHIQYPL